MHRNGVGHQRSDAAFPPNGRGSARFPTQDSIVTLDLRVVAVIQPCGREIGNWLRFTVRVGKYTQFHIMKTLLMYLEYALLPPYIHFFALLMCTIHVLQDNNFILFGYALSFVLFFSVIIKLFWKWKCGNDTRLDLCPVLQLRESHVSLDVYFSMFAGLLVLK
jgi:hypothetical protein